MSGSRITQDHQKSAQTLANHSSLRPSLNRREQRGHLATRFRDRASFGELLFGFLLILTRRTQSRNFVLVPRGPGRIAANLHDEIGGAVGVHLVPHLRIHLREREEILKGLRHRFDITGALRAGNGILERHVDIAVRFIDRVRGWREHPAGQQFIERPVPHLPEKFMFGPAIHRPHDFEQQIHLLRKLERGHLRFVHFHQHEDLIDKEDLADGLA